MLDRLFDQLIALCDDHPADLSRLVGDLQTQLASLSLSPSQRQNIEQLQARLDEQLARQASQRTECHQELLNSGQYLSENNYLTPALKEDLNLFQQRLTTQGLSLNQLMARLQELMTYFRVVLTNQGKVSLLKEQKLLKLTQNYAKQMARTLEDANLNADIRRKINSISHQLDDPLAPEQLFVLCQKLLVLLLDNMALDKAASQDFLVTLNSALANVRNVLSQTVNLSRDQQSSQHQWLQQFEQPIADIEQGLANADQLDQLKTTVSNALAQLTPLLEDKLTAERQLHQQMQSQLTSLTDRLNQVENEAREYQDKLLEQRQLSMRDSLTQLPNRAALDERLASEFRRSQHAGRNLWVVVADIDYFKRINDNYGHIAGDKTLQVIATALSRTLRESEFVARFGGEEFVILVPKLKESELRGMLNRVREKIKNIPFKFKREQVRITISLGAAQVSGDDEDELATFARADAALFEAKRLGRDQVVIASHDSVLSPRPESASSE